MTQGIKAKALAAHERCHGFYSYAEHGCAMAYAICEFSQLHILLNLLSAVLLIAGLAIVAIKIVLAVLS